MFEKMTNEHEMIFSDILTSRRSVKCFTDKQVEDNKIIEIINAGIIAPFAAIPAAGTDDFRKYLVISTKSIKYNELSAIINAKINEMEKKVYSKYGDIPYLNMLKQANKVGINYIIGKASHLIICAERKGFPENSKESLSFCIQNMWLKSVTLKVGVRIIALLSQIDLENDNTISELIGFKPSKYSVSCFVLGYPDESYIPGSVNYPDYNKVVSFYK